MKRIIGGKKYDTNTARQVGEWGNGYGYTDFQHAAETLYRKRTGEYFVHGSGGPMSRYAKPYPGGGWQGGDELVPLTYDQAREWAEEHLEADEYEAEFGEAPEGDGEEQRVVRLSGKAAAWIRREAMRRGVTMADVVDGLLPEQ